MDRKYQFCLFVVFAGVGGGGVIDYFFFHRLSFRYHRLDLLGIKYLVTTKL